MFEVLAGKQTTPLAVGDVITSAIALVSFTGAFFLAFLIARFTLGTKMLTTKRQIKTDSYARGILPAIRSIAGRIANLEADYLTSGDVILTRSELEGVETGADRIAECVALTSGILGEWQVLIWVLLASLVGQLTILFMLLFASSSDAAVIAWAAWAGGTLIPEALLVIRVTRRWYALERLQDGLGVALEQSEV